MSRIDRLLMVERSNNTGMIVFHDTEGVERRESAKHLVELIEQGQDCIAGNALASVIDQLHSVPGDGAICQARSTLRRRFYAYVNGLIQRGSEKGEPGSSGGTFRSPAHAELYRRLMRLRGESGEAVNVHGQP